MGSIVLQEIREGFQVRCKAPAFQSVLKYFMGIRGSQNVPVSSRDVTRNLGGFNWVQRCFSGYQVIEEG